MQKPVNTTLNKNIWLALIAVFAMVIAVREVFLLIATALGMPSIGNILGMVCLLIALLVWRASSGLPDWLIESSNRLLTESALAYLPVSAGAGILLFQLGGDFWLVMLVTIIATVPPLWLLARLADYWLHHRVDGSVVDDYASDIAKLGAPHEFTRSTLFPISTTCGATFASSDLPLLYKI